MGTVRVSDVCGTWLPGGGTGISELERLLLLLLFALSFFAATDHVLPSSVPDSSASELDANSFIAIRGGGEAAAVIAAGTLAATSRRVSGGLSSSSASCSQFES